MLFCESMGVEAASDPRGVANLLLDLADKRRLPVSNLALQKLLYFAHARFLVETRAPMVSGYFEAWQYGPVHPTVYQAFKSASERPISFRAEREDIFTGQTSIVACPQSKEIIRHAEQIIEIFGRMNAGRLIELSHATNGPWHYIVNKGETAVAFGLRIPDNVILERFKFHKVALGGLPPHGDQHEDAPFA